MKARERGPCPFCRSVRYAERLGRARTSPASEGLGSSLPVVLLEHEVGCPRHAPGAGQTLSPEDERAAFLAYLDQEHPPGEREPQGRGVRTALGLRLLQGAAPIPTTPELLTRLTEAAADVLGELPEVPDPRELACALLALACSTAEAADASLLPPIFLAAFLPTLGLSEAETIGLVRFAFAEHRRADEASIEAVRHEQIEREAQDVFRAQFQAKN